MNHAGRCTFAALSLLMLPPSFAAEPDVARSTQASEVDNRNASALPGRNTRPDEMQAQGQVKSAENVVKQMKRDAKVTALLSRAQGVFIVPTMGQAAAVVGGRGGEGVLLINRSGKWIGPAFFNFGRISAGPQAGGAVGPVAMILMNDEAVGRFTAQKQEFTLDATAGLTLVSYSKAASSTVDQADVVVWSDTDGLFAGASIGVTAIARDDAENKAYYGRATTPQEIFSEVVANDSAAALRQTLPARTASR